MAIRKCDRPFPGGSGLLHPRFVGVALACGLFTASLHGGVVINEVYGGGGNAGAVLRNDYVELFNNSATAFVLDNHKLEYAASAGTSWSGVTFPAGSSLAPGGFMLIQLASGGSAGALLPTPFMTGGTGMSATAGKLRLQNGSISGDALPDAAGVIDYVGWGTATRFEGTAASPGGSNAASVIRINDGVDTNQNGVDFQSTLSPSPGASNVPEPGVLGAGLALLVGLLRRRRHAPG